MTDVLTGAAPAAAESTAAPNEQAVSPPNPISTEPVVAPKEAATEAKETPKPSASDALKAAREKVEAREKENEAKAVKSEPAKAKEQEASNKAEATGAEKAKEQGAVNPEKQETAQQPVKSKYEAPKRFSADAQTDWVKTPETVQAEVARAHRELEEGLGKYKESHERYEGIRQFDEIARSNGHELKQSLEKVVSIEQAFARNPVEGFQTICDHFGINMRALAAHISGQKPEEVQSHNDQTVSELRRELAALQQQVGGVTSTFQKQQEAATSKEVESFAAANPRFYDLMSDVAFFLKSDKVDQNLPAIERLSEAYKLAERFNPSATQASAPAPIVEQPEDLTAQTLKGEKSITGAPSPGSNPANRQPSGSIKDSIKRALAQAG